MRPYCAACGVLLRDGDLYIDPEVCPTCYDGFVEYAASFGDFRPEPWHQRIAEAKRRAVEASRLTPSRPKP